MVDTTLPDIDLNGRVVIVTGADRGLGRAMSLALADTGAQLVLASPAFDALRVVAGEIAAADGADRAIAMETDRTDRASCRNCLAQTLSLTR